FRRMWRLPDEKADKKPPFVALMYHGRDTRAYDVPNADLDTYVAERVARVKAGDSMPLDLRLANGEVIRLQCTVLPSGGRMLCYTYVTDIVHHADELEVLRDALDQAPTGVVLLDQFLNVQFINRPMRALWNVSDDQAARKLSIIELMRSAHAAGAYAMSDDELSAFLMRRITMFKAGDPTPVEIPHKNGHIIRAECNALPNGGRMITYNDVTDLIRRAREFERLANTDGMTGVCNRRQFDVLMGNEWGRFQRYQRPLSAMIVDIDRFKEVNDKFGHETGDKALKLIAGTCTKDKRGTDIVARVGGDEFAILLPETALPQAQIVAERIRRSVQELELDGLKLSVSIGIVSATLSMSGPEAFLRRADEALYAAKAAGRKCIKCAEDATWPNYHAAAE
ncbi:MAG TPA: diguanylate cyclase, partial [Pseudolabrys sp.]|nr:diguanylate cyclase [Pseudolabrys sp.]